ncbi:hypothetical protein OESDEN_16277, partial [Oesophagostomum dentatum]
MKVALLVLVAVTLAGCALQKCSRKSQCPRGYLCKRGRCIRLLSPETGMA